VCTAHAGHTHGVVFIGEVVHFESSVLLFTFVLFDGKVLYNRQRKATPVRYKQGEEKTETLIMTEKMV